MFFLAWRLHEQSCPWVISICFHPAATHWLWEVFVCTESVPQLWRFTRDNKQQQQTKMWNRGVVVWAVVVCFITLESQTFLCSFIPELLLFKLTVWLGFILSQPCGACVLRCTWPLEPWALKASVCSLQSRSQRLYCPSMMDDGVYHSSIPLALLPLIGLKRVHLHSTSMVTGRVYVWIISACSPLAIACLMKTVPRQDSPQATRIDLARRLCLTLWLSLENRPLMWQEKTSLLALQLTWFQIPSLLLPWKSVAYVQ